MKIETIARVITSPGRARCVAALGFVVAGLSSPALGQPSSDGQWDPPPGGYEWPLEAIHAVHVATGVILVWDRHFPPNDPPNHPKL